MVSAIEAGLSFDSFWNLTPREYVLQVRARARRASAQTRRALAIAWHVAALIRVDRLPPLAEILNPPPSRPSEQELERRAREHREILKQMGRK